ncbi:leucine-rich repeat domain-containing protein [Thiolapillus sp.]
MRVLITASLLALVLVKSAVAAPVNCADEPATGVPQIECLALIALYDATSGAGWIDNSNWKTDAPVSDWYGIVVTSGSVTDVDLGENNLVGTIPVELGNLPGLQLLDLRLNSLSSPIPKELGSLGNLINLYLYSNMLSGSIPQELGSLPSLRTLSLGINDLTGAIPPELGNLGSLRHLYLHNNKFGGRIPPEIGGLSNLNTLWLHNNQLTGAIPGELGNLSLLRELYLVSNQLTGSIPPQLGQLTALTRLQLEDNNLEGAIPDTLNQIPPSTLYFRVNDNHLNADAQGNAVISGALQAWYDSIPVDSKNISRQTPPPQPGVGIDPLSGLVTTEDGGSDSFAVVLKRIPSADVIIAFTSSDTSEGSISPVSLTFTPDNWFMEQVVTLTGVDDALVDGNKNYSVSSTVTSSDAGYNGIATNDVSAMNIDNDQYGVTVSPVSGLVTTEDGGSTTFRVLLNAQPGADVTIDITSTDVGEGVVSPADLVFTPGNWNLQQIVSITGIDDALDDGNQGYTVQTNVVSDDPNYDGIESANVSVTNIDNDSAGVTISPTSGLVTSEDGSTATFNLRLNTRPLAEVTIALTSSDETEGTVLPAALVFSVDNWAAPQTATLTGIDDSLIDGDQSYSITPIVTSDDANYNGIATSIVSAINMDTNAAGVTISPASGLVTSEDGGMAVFNVFLSTQPAADVTIDLSSSDETEGRVQPGSLRFTPQDWNNSITVTITGQDDTAFDHDRDYVIYTSNTSSADNNYNNIDIPDVTVTNEDNESCSSPPDNVVIGFSSFSSSPDPYICIADAELSSAPASQPLTVEGGAEVRMYAPAVILNQLFRVESGGILSVAQGLP